jgi:ribokinase
MKVAVVGHIEWVEFARVDRVPEPGEIVSAHETWEEAAGGGAVAAVQLANLAGSCLFFTALADDGLGRRSREELEGRGVIVHSGRARGTQRRAFTYVDDDGERTITVLGEKLRASGEDGSLPWEELGRCDAVYFVSGDVAALRAARHCPVLVAAARELPIVVTTAGGLGGWIRPGGPFRAATPPGPVSDAYGCGDCFAAGLTYGLALGKPVDEAVALGARCGAAVLTGRGAYGYQLTGEDVQAG